MLIVWAILHELVKNMVNFELKPYYSMAISTIEKRLPPGKIN